MKNATGESEVNQHKYKKQFKGLQDELATAITEFKDLKKEIRNETQAQIKNVAGETKFNDQRNKEQLEELKNELEIVLKNMTDANQ